MALVAYGASDDSDLSEEEEEEAKPEKVTKNVLENGHISDEEDEFFGGGGDDFIPEKEEQDVFSLIAKKLPNVARMRKTKVAEVEEVGPIPEKKDYGVEIEQPPAKKSKFIGKEAKKTGPAKIVLPSLTDFKEEEEEALPSVRVEPSRSGSGLFALLPRPKNKNYKMPARAPSLPSSSTSSSSTPTPVPPLLSTPVGGNLKPSGAVRRVGLVPHRVANPAKPKPRAAEEEEEEEEDLLGVAATSSSYFPAPEAPARQTLTMVNPTPEGPSSSLRSLSPALPADNSFVSLNMADDVSATGTPYQDLALGPAVAPYPPPAPTYTEARDSLIDNDEALTRLAGKASKMREFKDELKGSIIDVSEDDMKGDPREWLTKAMTEERAPMPSGKGPKGLAKSRHQITYLAHQAKERDWELKQEWATARENRTASRNKYGFL